MSAVCSSRWSVGGDVQSARRRHGRRTGARPDRRRRPLWALSSLVRRRRCRRRRGDAALRVSSDLGGRAQEPALTRKSLQDRVRPRGRHCGCGAPERKTLCCPEWKMLWCPEWQTLFETRVKAAWVVAAAVDSDSQARLSEKRTELWKHATLATAGRIGLSRDCQASHQCTPYLRTCLALLVADRTSPR